MTLEVLPGPAVTHGESIAYDDVDDEHRQQHVHPRRAPAEGPVVDLRRRRVSASLVTSSCNAVIEGNEAVCTFGKLSSGATITATLLWAAPASGAGCTACLTTDGTWLIKEGKPTNDNEAFGFPDGAFSVNLLGGDGSSETRKAGGYETEGSAAGCTAGAGNLHTNATIGVNNPVTSTVCLPGVHHRPRRRVLRLRRDDRRGRRPAGRSAHKELGQSDICVAALGQSCGMYRRGHTPV